MMLYRSLTVSAVATLFLLGCAHRQTLHAPTHTDALPDSYIKAQRHALATQSANKGYGPQAPRDIDSKSGSNPVYFALAPQKEKMNLCNIHFHKNAEHKGGEFSLYASNGDGHGYGGGYRYGGGIDPSKLQATQEAICPSKHGSLVPGDTIEVHYVYTTADVKPGATLGACFNDVTKNPQLRVEAQVYVVVNDPKAADFTKLTQVVRKNGFYQAPNIPKDTGNPIVYRGSTTGPKYNEKGSPYQVTWSVRPKVKFVDINTVGAWCKGNLFDEDHAHGVRNLVLNPQLLSPIR